MKRFLLLLAVIIMLLSVNNIEAGAGEIVNGSFEADGWIDDITVEEPNGWDVNMPGNFGGWVYNDWVTDGSFNLTISTYWYTAFEANDIALVSQDVILKDVKKIIFDVKLDTYPAYAWNPNKRTAAVLIDDEIVWESDVFGEDVRGEYFEQVIDVHIDDRKAHKLSLALIADVNEEWLDVETMYYADWDYIGFDCRGNGVLPGDLNRDCVVDEQDLEMLTDVWLDWIDSRDKYNLYDSNDVEPYGVINFRDYAVLADVRDCNDYSDMEEFTSVWLDEVEPADEMNLYRGDDVGPYGVINFRDYAVFADIRDSNDYSDLQAFTGVWLLKVPLDDEWNLYSGDDVWPLDIINFFDLAVFAENWLVGSYD